MAKPRNLPRPPAGDFARGDLLWMERQLWPMTSSFVLTIPHKPPSLNELNQLRAVDAVTRGAKGYNAFKAAWQRIIRHYWVTQAFTKGEGPPTLGDRPYKVSYAYLCADRRSDVSNLHAAFEKILLDALSTKRSKGQVVAPGALGGDSFKYHRGSSYQPEYTPGQWGVVVTFSAFEESGLQQPADGRKRVGRFRSRRASAGKRVAK